MAGYVIHIAVAQEYLRKHKLEYNKNFINGSILPDLTEDKTKTHYGKSPAYTNLLSFLENNKLNNSLIQGQFIHLITDYLFYNYYLTQFSKKYIYNDYDILNKSLMETYHIKLPDEIKNKVFFIDGKTKILNYNLACKIIDEISDLDIFTVEKEVLDHKQKWFYYRNIV